MVRLLTALALAAAPAFSQDQKIDWTAVRRNTAAFESRQQRRDAQAAAGTLDSQLANRLARAQQLVGPGAQGLSRLVPHGVPVEIASASVEVQEAMALLVRRRGQVEQTFADAEQQLERVPNNEVLKLRLAQQRSVFDARMLDVTRRLTEVGASLDNHGAAGDGLLQFGRQLLRRDDQTALEELRETVRGWSVAPLPIQGASTLNYVHGDLEPQPLSTEAMTPAYLRAGASGLALEDTTTGREVEVSTVVRAKADALAGPLEIYEFVKNQLALDWYLGALKGSTETLREARGNDADLSSLLIALLRAKDIPARFVRGTIELPVERLADLMGLLTTAEIDQLYSRPAATPFSLDAARRSRVLQALNAAGIPYTPTMAGGQVATVRLSHIWVEAFISYADYRGVGTSIEGKQWVPMDAAIPGGPKYAATAPSLDVIAAMAVDARALTAGYLLDGTSPSPMDFYRAQVRSYLTTSAPTVPWDATLRHVNQRTEQLELIPGSLPYTVVSVQEESPFLPDALKHRARLTAGDSAGLFVDITLPLHQLVAHRALLAYEPATDVDRALVQQAGALYGAPAALVQVVAAVRVDGEQKAIATRAVALGSETSWSLELLLPNGSTRRIDNALIAGNSVALGLGGPFNRYTEAQPRVATDTDGFGQRFLYERAVAYANEWTAAEEELAQLTQVVLVRPTANVAFVQNQLHVESTLGVRQRVELRGLEIDADLRTAVPLELIAGRAQMLLELSGHQGSFLEAKVLSDGVGERAISATEVIREANRRGLEVLQLTPGTSAALSRLTASPEVLRDVADQLALGREVSIPVQPMTVENWNGTGYISIEPTSREAGYFLSGIVSGGSTVVDVALWRDQSLVAQLLDPRAPQPTNDLTKISRILALPTVKALEGTVGIPLSEQIGVVVTTDDGTPVVGAPVRFSRLPGTVAEPLIGGRDFFDTVTDVRGFARTTVAPDTQILRKGGFSAFTRPGVPFEQVLGLNEVTATVCTHPCSTAVASLLTPFEVVGLPDVVSTVAVSTSVGGLPSMELPDGVRAVTTDKWGNLLANEAVEWDGAPRTGRFVQLRNAQAVGTRLLDENNPLQSPTVTEPSTTLGVSTVAWIAGPTPGDYTLRATARSMEGSTQVHIAAATDDFVFRLNFPLRNSWAGIYGTSFPVPISGQVLTAVRNGASTRWAPISGAEPELALSEFKVTIRTVDGNGAELGTASGAPTDTAPAVLAPYRDGVSTPFRPTYRLGGGTQTIVASASVSQLQSDGSGGTRKVKVCCSDQWRLAAPSSLVDVFPVRRKLGAAFIDQRDGFASVDDAAVGFRLAPHSSAVTWVRITQRPTVTGQDIIFIPDESVLRRHPVDKSLIELPADFEAQLTFEVVNGTAGGFIDAEIFALDYSVSPAVPIVLQTDSISPDSVTRIVVQPRDATLSAQTESQGRLVLPVRNYASAVIPDAGTEAPFTIPAVVQVAANASGVLTIRDGPRLISDLEIEAGQQGVSSFTERTAGSATLDGKTGRLRVFVPSDVVGTRTLRVTLTQPPALNQPPQSVDVDVTTTADDMGALPVGHVFVKDVSVVDGHLVKQGEAIRVPGRGPPLAFNHSYTNRGFSEGSMGQGWSNSLDSEVIENVSPPFVRLAVVGGEGTGQAFRCDAERLNCKTQVGYHGVLWREVSNRYQADGGAGISLPDGGLAEPLADGGAGDPLPPAGVYIAYRARGGTTYRYGPAQVDSQGVVRYPVASITDAQNNTQTIEYLELDKLPFRQWEAGNARYLQFAYEKVKGAPRKRLRFVRLFENPQAPTRLKLDGVGNLLNACVEYQYEPLKGRLTSIRRFDGDCGDGPLIRSEGFAYSPSLKPSQLNNIIGYIDPNRVETQFEYYAATDALPGEGAFTLWGDKEERIKAVLEPGVGAAPFRTGFAYSLVQAPLAPLSGSQVLNVYNTTVESPRPDVPPTIYKQQGYGSTANVIRPLDATTTAESRVEWDPVHVKPVVEVDARGRETRYRYDDFGNMTERRVGTTALAPSGAGDEAEQVVDATGALIDQVVQKWTYDPSFSKPTCEMDAEGRITLHQLDSTGADPRSVNPDAGVRTGSGLVLSTRRYAAPVSRALATGTSTCADIAAGLAPSSSDIVTTFRYCGINANCASVPNAKSGDLYETLDGEQHTTRIAEYDTYGLPKVVARIPRNQSLPILTTTTAHDARGRATESTDSRGKATTYVFDGLDRLTCENKKNTRGTSPGILTVKTYYASGDVKDESVGGGNCGAPTTVLRTRHVDLDGRNRPAVVTESGVLLTTPIVTKYGYDEADNRVSVIDGRGVRTATTLDFADRAISTTVSVGEPAAFAAAGGLGSDTIVTAQAGYDAVGNKVFEKDLHQYRTDFHLDALYRTVRTTMPAVPGLGFTSSTIRYETKRRFDLVGNAVREEDGNGNPTLRQYDFANRLVSTTDAVGRTELGTWDDNGNRLTQTQKTDLTTHLTRTTSYDALNRPLNIVELFLSGLTQKSQTRSMKYDDTAAGHAMASRDARGFVTSTKLDDLDRPYVSVTDDGAGLLPRAPDDSRAGPALQLTSKVEYDGLGNASAVIDARGVRTETDWDAAGRQRAKRYALGVTESWTPNAGGAVIAMTDKRGVVRQFKYDVLGREKQRILVESLTKAGAELIAAELTYADGADSDGLWSVSEVDAAGSTNSRFIDAMGRTVKSRDALNKETVARYDAQAQRKTRDAKGYVTETDTDAVYRPTAVRELDVGATAPTYARATSYDDVARLETANDWRGTPTVLERDGLGRLVRRARGTGTQKQTDLSSFNAGGQETLHTDANGHQTEWAYDGAGRKIRETKAFGSTDAATWTHRFDEVGNEVEMKGPRTATAYDVRTTFDGLNRAVRVEDALRNVTVRAYDGAGLLQCEKTPLGDLPNTYGHGAAPTTESGIAAAACVTTHVTKYEYEELGQLTKVTTALGHETTYVWDASRKRMLSKQDGNGHLTTYAYDARAQRTEEYQHLDTHARVATRDSVPGFETLNLAAETGTLKWSATYDDNGNIATRTDALGQVTTETHGLRNRLDATRYSLHTQPRVLPSVDEETTAYDENGNPLETAQKKQTTTGVVTETTVRTFDRLDRLETETRYDGKLTTYGNDVKGNRSGVTDFEGVSTRYEYDAQDRLKRATVEEGATEYTYFGDGLEKTRQAFNGMYEGRCYDEAGRLSALVTARTAVADGCAPPAYVSRYRYGYDGEGNRVTQDEELTSAGGVAAGPSERTAYGYDEESRLVGVRYPDETVALYQLDAVGNRVGERKAPSSAVASLTMAAFLAVSPGALTHDVVAVFNGADWLKSVTDTKAAEKNASFEWDAAGNLKRQVSGGKERHFDWDVKQTLTRVTDDGVEVGRYDYGATGLRSKRVTASESVEYVLDGMAVLVETDGASVNHAAKRRYHYGTAALAVTDIGASRTTRVLHLDALGSPGTETTAGAQVSVVRQYDAWGVYRNGTAPVSGDAKLGYTGHQYDVETGLVYARARYYDAEYGRFLSRDSVEGNLNSAPSLHRYGYVHGNPLRYRDANGRVALCVLGGFLGCVLDNVNQAIFTAGFVVSGNSAPLRGYQSAEIDMAKRTVEGAGDSALMMGAWPGAVVAQGLYAGAQDARRCIDGGGGVGCVLGAGDSAVTLAGQFAELANTPSSNWTYYQGSALQQESSRLDVETQKVGIVVGGVSAGVRELLASSEAAVVQGEIASREVAPASTGLVEECEAGACLQPGKCFVAGTLVLTDTGLRPIETIRRGDVVFSKSDRTGETGWKHVLATRKTLDRAVVQLRFVDAAGHEESVTATPTHPFWVEGQGWTAAGELAAGMLIPTAQGGWLRVEGATWLQAGADVFNFEVEEWHTYFVGEAGAWVHNIGNTCPPGDVSYRGPASDQARFNANESSEPRFTSDPAAESGVVIRLKKPAGVSDAAWEAKLQKLNDGVARGEAKVVHNPVRDGAAQRQARQSGAIAPGHHADHGLDLQYGGADDISNITSTPGRINTSVGGQGRQRMAYPDGTPISGFVEE